MCMSYSYSPEVLDRGQSEAVLEFSATLLAADEYLPLSCVFSAPAGPSGAA